MAGLLRRIFISFCLISIIPLLVFAYLTLPRVAVDQAEFTFVIVFITVVMIILGLSLLLGIDRRISKLSMVANLVSRGDVTHELQVKSDDDIAGLSESLNQITRKIRDNMNDLQTRAILIERTNRELSRLNKLKSEFVYMVSHELRAPLINIKEVSSLLLGRQTGYLNPQQERCLSIVSRSATRLLKLIENLLDIARIESGELRLDRQIIDINKIIKDATESLEQWREFKKIDLQLEIEPNLPDIYGDPDRINQVLVNLLSNAIKFTPAHGRIIIKAQMQRGGEDFVEISVIDTGPGIPLEYQDKIFGRFNKLSSDFHADANSPGTGLGLSITKDIITMHGGKIWVESKPKQGSRFAFILPEYKPEQILKRSLQTRISRAREEDKEFSIFIIKLNNYSQIKKGRGEKGARGILLNIFDAAKEIIKGGEFILQTDKNEVVILAGITKEEFAETNLRLKRRVKERIFDRTQEQEIDFSYGGYSSSGEEPDVTRLLRLARESLVSEKRERLKKNITVIDDDCTVVETLKRLLRKRGYSNFIEAYSGEDALQKLRHLIPDLIILDIKMPKMNGYEMFRILKSDIVTKDIPVIVITGYDVEMSRLEQYSAGKTIPVMDKPVNIDRFIRVVNYLL